MSNFNYLSRQNHVSLVSQPHTIQNFVKSFADRVNSYHDHDRSTAQGNQFAPQFNVTETKSSYVLDGEVPGVGDQSSIHVVWLQNHVLLINGVISCPPTGEASEGVQEGQENEWTSSKGKTLSRAIQQSQIGYNYRIGINCAQKTMTRRKHPQVPIKQ